jgi:transcriptional regulator with XRE-family HTH domain
MDDIRIGNAVRAVRLRRRLRQADVADRAVVRRELVGRLERGGAGTLPLDAVRAVAAALGIRLELRLHWQGGDLDRVVNAAHADLHESLARRLQQLTGWTWLPEVSFSIYGERGVIDILAWHEATRSLLIVELKTTIIDPRELVATMDRRLRLGERIAADHGWRPASVSAWVVVSDTRTNHRRVLRHARLLRTAFPADGHQVRGWLRRPDGSIRALSFWTDVRPGDIGRAQGQPRRVRAPRHA